MRFLSIKATVFLALVAMILTGAMLMCAGCALSDKPKIEKASPVDVSSLKSLANYQVYDLDELKARFETISAAGNGLHYVSDGDWSGGGGGNGVWQYKYYAEVQETRPTHSVDVLIYIFNTPEHAQNFLGSNVPISSYSVPSKKVTISSGVKATLYSVIRYKDPEGFEYVYPAFLYTEVCIGNVVYDFQEKSNDLNSIGTLTNKGLSQISQALEK